ncbi:hypothetical protein L6164_000513 [Bauhinia variegata]|uniref:Uncharacterized protein n=1 Tax=Bauhinia variegata TaxID=167791 RepID=A0ACB9Q9E5_BAUVA|nr:hypothetical protein L6164_000513 [Bauhinia variegata]
MRKLSGMKLDDDEDLGRPDRVEAFQTDDEENQAERAHLDDDTDSDSSSPSTKLSISVDATIWPQSYRQSMDMLTSVTPPPVSFLRNTASTGAISFLSSAYKRSQVGQSESSLIDPLIPSTSSIKEEEPTLVQGHFSSCSKFSYSELPPPQKQCSFAQSVLNGTNILCGLGLLTTPYALKQGGWFSLTILLMFAIMCYNTGILLRRCLDSSPGLETYPDIGQAAFGSAGRLGISIALYLELYASCVEYIILMTDNLCSIFPNTQMRIAGIDFDAQQTLAIIVALVVLPTVWLRNLSLLSYLSVGGIFASILVTTSLFWVGVDQVGFHPGGKAIDLANLSVTIGLYGFGFAGHSVFPNIYSSMKEPSKFPAVLMISFGFCFVMYTGVAIAGYLMFGDSIKTQYTLNMPQELYASKIAVWTTIVIPLNKFALTLLPVALSIEELLPSPKLRNYATSVVVRTLLVFSCLVVALTFPYFGAVMALIGSALAMSVALVIPCASYLKIFNGRLSKTEVGKCFLIIVVGVVCALLGTYSAITRLASKGE